MRHVSIELLAVAVVLWLPLGQAVNKWQYSLLGMNFESNNRSMFEMDPKLELIHRGLYGFSAVMNVSDTFLDGNSLIEIQIGHNTRYNKNFERTPYKVQQQTLLTFINGFYKKFLSSSLDECSNMPHLPTKLETLQGYAGQYTCTKCQVDISKVAKMVVPGYYLVEAFFTRKADPTKAVLSINAKVDSILS